MSAENDTNGKKDTVAGKLAQWIVTGGILFLIITTILTLFLPFIPGWSNQREAFTSQWKDMLTMILPVIAAWVGTVLAYYFTKENFESANRHAIQLTKLSLQDRLTSKSAKEVMIPGASISAFTVEKDKTLADYTLGGAILPKLSIKNTRIPVINQGSDIVIGIFHKSIVYEILFNEKNKDSSTDPTLEKLFSDASYSPVVKAIAFAGEAASLADVQNKMKSVPHCQDVFITKSGDCNEAIIGWITNAEIAKVIEAC